MMYTLVYILLILANQVTYSQTTLGQSGAEKNEPATMTASGLANLCGTGNVNRMVLVHGLTLALST